MKKKYLWNLGFYAVTIIPVVSVISCGEQKINFISNTKKEVLQKIESGKIYTSTKNADQLDDNLSGNHSDLHTKLGLNDAQNISNIPLNGVQVNWNVQKNITSIGIDLPKKTLLIEINLTKLGETPETIFFKVDSHDKQTSNDEKNIVKNKILTKLSAAEYTSSIDGSGLSSLAGTNENLVSDLGLSQEQDISKINTYGWKVTWEAKDITIHNQISKPIKTLEVKIYLSKLNEKELIKTFKVNSRNSQTQHDLDITNVRNEILKIIPENSKNNAYLSTLSGSSLETAYLGDEKDLHSKLGLGANKSIANIALGNVKVIWQTENITINESGKPTTLLKVTITLNVDSSLNRPNQTIVFYVKSSDTQK